MGFGILYTYQWLLWRWPHRYVNAAIEIPDIIERVVLTSCCHHRSSGLSAGLLLLFSGEILGSSGISSSIVLEPKKHMTEPYHAWKLVFLATFLLFSNVCLAKYFTNDERLGTDPSIPIVSKWGYLLGGLFVGFGTRLSNGCTTGHGIVSSPLGKGRR